MTAPRRILAVDDDPKALAALEQHLAAAGFEVRAVSDPSRAPQEARAFQPALVVCERALKALTGGELIRALRGQAQTASVPVAFVVADGSDREMVRSIVAGAVDVLPKPFVAAHAARVGALLDELESRQGAAPEGDPTALNFVDCARRTRRHGTVVVNRGTPFEGRVVFERGAMIRAEYGPLSGLDAVRELLALEDGVFEFDDTIESPPVKKYDTVAELVLPTSVTNIGTDPRDLRPRLLVVDDEPHLRQLFSAQLGKGGFDVEVAGDGDEAIARALATPFDVVLADLSMPRMDGWVMLKMLKRDHRTREVPVIFLSAHDDYRETLKAAKAGAHDYLAKTGRSEHVLKSVSTVIAPRLETFFELIINQPMKVRTQAVGVQWLLRSLTRLQATGTLKLSDDWGHYELYLEDGQPISITATAEGRRADGMAALASLLVAHGPSGTFTPGAVEVPAGDRLKLSMESLLQRTCEQLNALEARLTADRLAAAEAVDVDLDLYALYRRIAPERRIALARAVCEQRVAPAALGSALGLGPELVAEGLTDLLRRGVIKLR